jgi:hypothetical protein
MKVLLGLLKAYRRSRRMESGVLIIGLDMDTNQVHWASIQNAGTERATYTGHVRQLAKYWTPWR